MMCTDEAGFEALTGTDESRMNSDLYSEKVVVLSKRFIAHALFHQILGLDDVLDWVYLSESGGPHVLEMVVEDCQKLLQNSAASDDSATSGGDVGTDDSTREDRRRLSSGAAVLLGRHLSTLKQRLEMAQDTATT